MSLWKNLIYSLRMVRKSPVQYLVILVTLAVGIGANSAMYSIIDGVLLRPLMYPEADHVVTMTTLQQGVSGNPLSYPDYEDWVRQSKAFSSITASRAINFNFLQGDTAERVRGLRASVNFLSTLGIAPEVGRDFRPEEGVAGNEFVAMITHEFWQSHFAGSRDVIGKPLLLGRVPYVLVGVLPPRAMPQSAMGIGSPDIVVPFTPRQNERNRGLNCLRVYGRIKNGVPFASAVAEMQVINAAIERAEPSFHTGAKVEVTPLHEAIVGKVRPMILVLLAAVAVILLICCVNVASILLGRSSVRSGELAVRSALGARRRELITQLLTESAVLGFLGAALGLALGALFISMARHYAGTMLPRADQIAMNWRILLVTLVAALFSSFLFGILPAWKASSAQPVDAMKRQGRSSGIGSRSALRALLIGELAITLVLMVTSVLAVRSFIRLSSVPAGFDPEGVVAANIELPPATYTSVEQSALFFHNAVERVRALPGIESVGASGRLPLVGFNQSSNYQAEGQNLNPADWPSADIRVVTPGYFRTMGIPLIAGRDYNDNDRSDTPPVAVVNQEFIRRFWPNESGIGRKLEMYPQTTLWREIVGVVGDVRLLSLDAQAGPTIYIVTTQNPFLDASRNMFIVMKVKSGAESVYPLVQKEIRSIDTSQAVSELVNMREAVSTSLARNRLTMVLLLTFGGIALILAAVGVYGVVGLFVSSRMQEIGIRMALGAKPSQVMRMILGETALFSAIAIVLGGAVGFFAARMMKQLLFEIPTGDPPTFAITFAVIVITTLLAALVPTVRAMRTDPLVVLRVE